MRIKRWIVLSLASVFAAAALTGCVWWQDGEEDGSSSSSSSSSSSTSSRPSYDDDDGGSEDKPEDPVTYTVIANIGTGGKVTINNATIESGSYSVQKGTVLTFTVQPNEGEGYQIGAVTANGDELTGKDGTYTYTVNSNCTIEVTFQYIPKTFTMSVTASPSEGGSFVYDNNATEGESWTLTIKPESGYIVNTVIDNDTNVTGRVKDNIYTIENIIENHTITVTFASTINPNDASTWPVINGTLIVPANVETLPDNTKDTINDNDKNITGLDLSQSDVTSIDEKAFEKCTKLQTVNLGSVKSIGNNAFQSCTSLQNVDLSNVTSIGNNAFQSCTSLQNVDLSNVTSIGKSAFSHCAKLETVNLGSDVTEISNFAFLSCESLETVDLRNITSIGNNAFQFCTSLQNADLSNVISIGHYAFGGCTSLQNVDMGSVTNIDNNAFQNCTSLTNIRLGNIPLTVYHSAFSEAGPTNGKVTIYSDKIGAEPSLQAQVTGWFDGSVEVAFASSRDYDSLNTAAGNALAQYLLRHF